MTIIDLAIVTQPHAVKSRYPENGFNPIEFYDENLPLVQVLPKFHEITGRTILRVERIASFIEEAKVNGKAK